MRRLFIIICVVLYLTACEKPETTSINGREYISASACAKRLSNGEVLDCQPSDEARDELRNMLRQTLTIDKEHPGPKGPDILNLEYTRLYRVRSISNEGVILLENDGTELLLAGVECDIGPSLDFLKASFIRDQSARLAYLSTGLTDGKREYAYIWVVAMTDNSDFGPTLSSINEGLITSGWCKPVMQEKHFFHRRYQRLANID